MSVNVIKKKRVACQTGKQHYAVLNVPRATGHFGVPSSVPRQCFKQCRGSSHCFVYPHDCVSHDRTSKSCMVGFNNESSPCLPPFPTAPQLNQWITVGNFLLPHLVFKVLMGAIQLQQPHYGD